MPTSDETQALRTWEWYGRYGDYDDPQTVRVNRMPSELSIEQQLKLFEVYKTRTVHGVSEFEALGLCREVGNAWNNSIRWSPQVSSWVQSLGTADPSASIKERSAPKLPDSFSDFSP